MRSGASVSQLFASRRLPRAARSLRFGSLRVGVSMGLVLKVESAAQLEAAARVVEMGKGSTRPETPGRARNQERRLCVRELEQRLNRCRRHYRTHDVLDALQRGDFHQVFVRGDA